MDKKWFTVKEFEKKTEIPEGTIRRYIRNHGHRFEIKKKGKGYLLSEGSLKIIQTIRNLYNEGKSISEVEDVLGDRGDPVTITVDAMNAVDDTVHTHERQIDEKTAKALKILNERMDEQMDFNRSLLEILQSQQEEIQKQREYIREILEERDYKLIQGMKDLMETRKQIASTSQSEEQLPKKKWWRFW